MKGLMMQKNTLKRAKCPFCGTILSGVIERLRNHYKLDNSDPDYLEKTVCLNCEKHVFTINNGKGLDPSYKESGIIL